MAKKPSYSVHPLPKFSRNGRGIAFLLSTEDRHCNAKGVFDKLKGSAERAVLTAFDGWLDHNDRLTNRFHGWPGDPAYRGCFTFKWKEGNSGQRFYGFLHNVIDYQKGFQICVLVLHTRKNERATDKAELDRILERKQKTEVQEALDEAITKLKSGGWPKS
jgi:hypothetical protein